MALELNGTTGVSAVQAGAVESGDLPAGSVIQVVSTTKTDTFSVLVSGSGNADVTGLAASISPISSNSRILVLTTLVGHTSVEGGIHFNVKRNGSFIGNPSGSSSFVPLLAGNLGVSNPSIQGGSTASIVDEPSTTSSLNYQVSIVNIAPSARTHYVNRSEDGTRNLSVSSITVMEIAG